MKLLEKLKMPEELESEYPSNSVDDYEGNPERDFPEIAADDPRRDPAPGEAPPRKARAAAGKARSEPARITKKHRDDAQEEIETFLQVMALTWGLQAPPCGDALETAAPDIAARLTKLLARNPRWLLRVREGGILADALSLALSLRPVVAVAWSHYSQPKGGDGDGVEFDPAQFPPYDGAGISR